MYRIVNIYVDKEESMTFANKDDADNYFEECLCNDALSTLYIDIDKKEIIDNANA